MSYLFDIRKLKKIIFGFLIVFSFFQVCGDSFADPLNSSPPPKNDKKVEVKKDKEEKSKKTDENKKTSDNSNSDENKKAKEDLENKKIDTRIDAKLKIIIIGLILSLLLNFIFITLYFIGNKKLNAKINKLIAKSKSQNSTNESSSSSFVNINKYIVAFEKGFENIHTEINHINKDINYIQNSINEKNRAKSLRDELRKDDKPYQEEEIKKPISPIKNLCNKHAEMSNREFIKNYPNAIKLDITNAEDVVYRNNDPIFQETDQGKYIAIALPELENSNHYLFYAKGTNITSEDIALKTVFTFDKEYEKAKIYDEWKIIEPAILNMNNNNWQIFKKGKIEL